MWTAAMEAEKMRYSGRYELLGEAFEKAVGAVLTSRVVFNLREILFFSGLYGSHSFLE